LGIGGNYQTASMDRPSSQKWRWKKIMAILKRLKPRGWTQVIRTYVKWNDLAKKRLAARDGKWAPS
jgi:hypothetical protein